MRTKVAVLQQTVELINEMRKGNQAEAGRLIQADPVSPMTPLRRLFAIVTARPSSPACRRSDRRPRTAAHRHGRRPRPHATTGHDQDSRQGPEQTERFTQTYKVSADGALDLQTSPATCA